jgi:hypothetical protein
MPELTDAQKVNREVTQKRIATALETLAQNSEAPIGLGMTGATVGQVPFVKTVDENGVPTSYEPGAGAGSLPAGGTDGDVLVKNGATDYAAKWTNTPPQMGSLAYINIGNIANRSYSEGDYLVYNGQLYKVTATTISQDQTLNPGQGGNISVPEGGGLNDLKNCEYQEIKNSLHTLIHSQISSLTVEAAGIIKIGKLTQISGRITASSSVAANLNIPMSSFVRPPRVTAVGSIVSNSYNAGTVAINPENTMFMRYNAVSGKYADFCIWLLQS